jgi:hypothetical protein
MALGNYLTLEEHKEIHSLAKLEAWGILKRLLDQVELSVLRELHAFTNPNDAYERRGKVAGVRLVAELLLEITPTLEASNDRAIVNSGDSRPAGDDTTEYRTARKAGRAYPY